MIVRQFLLWARSAPEDARAKASSALARAYLRSELGAGDRATMEAALPLMIADPSPLVRMALAEAFCRHPLVPADLVIALGALEGEPGAIVLARSPVLNERELVEFCETGDASKQRAIASRTRLTAPIAAALAETGDVGACLVLVRNEDADVPGFALGRIIARHGHLPAMREALLERPDLPAAAHHALIRAVAGALSAFIVEREWMAPNDAARVEKEACDKATVACADTREAADVRALVEQLCRQGQLTPSLVLRALLSGQIRLFLESVSVLSGLPTDRVAALAADRSGSAFRALYDRIGLPRGAYVAFRTALQVVQKEAYVDEQDEAVGLKRRIVERVLEQYAALGEQEAGNKLVGVLRRWQAEAVRDEHTLAA